MQWHVVARPLVRRRAEGCGTPRPRRRRALASARNVCSGRRAPRVRTHCANSDAVEWIKRLQPAGTDTSPRRTRGRLPKLAKTALADIATNAYLDRAVRPPCTRTHSRPSADDRRTTDFERSVSGPARIRTWDTRIMSPCRLSARSRNQLRQAASRPATNCNELRKERERGDKPVHTAYAHSAVAPGNTAFEAATARRRRRTAHNDEGAPHEPSPFVSVAAACA